LAIRMCSGCFVISRKSRLRVYEHSSLKRTVDLRGVTGGCEGYAQWGAPQHVIRVIISRRMR